MRCDIVLPERPASRYEIAMFHRAFVATGAIQSDETLALTRPSPQERRWDATRIEHSRRLARSRQSVLPPLPEGEGSQTSNLNSSSKPALFPASSRRCWRSAFDRILLSAEVPRANPLARIADSQLTPPRLAFADGKFDPHQ
jgi:hypothetical protein